MKPLKLTLLVIILFAVVIERQEKKLNKLTPEEERVIINKGTEMPWTGEYTE